jgi:N-acetylglucosamine repressor
LDFNSNYKYMIAIDFNSENVKVALGNMKRQCVGILNVKRKKMKIDSELIKSVFQSIYQLIDENGVDKQDIAVIVLGIPGIVDEFNNIVQTDNWFEGLEYKQIDSIIKKEFNAQVIMKNDINLAAIGETHFGAGKTCDNLILINIDMGVGAGIIIDGNVYTGKNYAAGEVGFIIPNIGDIDNETSGNKKLESFISIPAIMEKLTDRLKYEPSMITQFANGDTNEVNFNAFVKGVLAGDPCCEAIANDVIRYIAWLIINLTCLLDIHFYVIDGSISELGDYLEKKISAIVKRVFPETLPEPLKTINVKCSELKDMAGIYGAFVTGREYILGHIFD